MAEEKKEETKQEERKEIILTLNIRKHVLKAPRFQRAKKAIKVLRELLKRYTKSEIVKISKSLNEFIWSRGIKKPPVKIKVKILKKDNVAYADITRNN